MKTYRGINYEVKNLNYVHFYNPKGEYYHESNVYGRGSLVRSFPEGCKLSVDKFAKIIIDNLYDRMEAYQKTELRLYSVSKSNRYVKNTLNNK